MTPAPSGPACRASAAPAHVLLVQMAVEDIAIGDRVWLDGQLQRVQDITPAGVPFHTVLAVDTGASFVFPNSGHLQVQYSPVEWPVTQP